MRFSNHVTLFKTISSKRGLANHVNRSKALDFFFGLRVQCRDPHSLPTDKVLYDYKYPVILRLLREREAIHISYLLLSRFPLSITAIVHHSCFAKGELFAMAMSEGASIVLVELCLEIGVLVVH